MKQIFILIIWIRILFISNLFGQNSFLLTYKLPEPQFEPFSYNEGCIELKNRNILTSDNIYNYANDSTYWIITCRDTTGKILWTKSRFNRFFHQSPFHVDKTGDIYFFGENNNHSASVTKTDPEGNLLWHKIFGQITEFWSGTVCDNGDLVLCGTFEDLTLPNPEIGGYLLKISSDGDVLWQRNIGSAPISSGFGNYFYFIKKATDGGFFVLGNKSLAGGCQDLSVGCPYLVKTDSLGIVQWANIYGCGFPSGLELLPDGSCLINTFGGSYITDRILKIDPAGNLIWAKEYKFNLDSITQFLTNKLVLNGDEILSLGTTYTSAYILSYNLDGEINWINKLSANNYFTVFIELLKISNGGFLISGYFDIYSGIGEFDRSSLLCLTKPNGDAPCQFTKDYNPKIEIKNYIPTIESNIIVKNIDFIPVDVILKDTTIEISQQIICYTTATQEVKEKAISLQLYPNPANNALSIDINTGNKVLDKSTQVYISDGLGRVLISVKPSFDGHADIDISGLSPGIYFASLRARSYIMVTAKFIVVR